jgi:hypothetical protein
LIDQQSTARLARSAEIELETMPASASRDSEPLLSPGSGPSPEQNAATENFEENAIKLGWFVWVLTFTAALSGLLFGYE